MRTTQIKLAWSDGKLAHHHGCPMSDCPYAGTLATCWLMGYREGEAESFDASYVAPSKVPYWQTRDNDSVQPLEF